MNVNEGDDIRSQTFFLRSAVVALSLTLSVLCFVLPSRDEPPVKVGALFSLSGWGGLGGTSDFEGALLAEEEINAAGGIYGRPLKLIVEDNHSDLKDTATALQKLIKIEKVSAIVGPNWAEFAEIAVPLADAAKIPLISTSGYKDGLYTGRHYVFTLWPPHRIATKPLADLLKRQNKKSLAVLLTENGYLEGIYQALKDQLAGSTTNLQSLLRFNPGQTDFRAAISRLKSGNYDAVLILLLENGSLSNFLVQAQQLRLNLPLFTANGIPFDEIIKEDPRIAEGVIYYDFTVPEGSDFRERFVKRFQKEPGFASAKGYDALFLIKWAVERCGENPKSIRSCLASSKFEGLSGEISFDQNGVIDSIAPNTYLLQVKDGRALALAESLK